MAATGTSNGPTADSLKQRVGANIRTARLGQGLTQSQLANRVEVNSGQIVSDWERGIAAPSPTNFAALAMELGRDIGWFYTDHSPAEAAA